MNMPRWYEKFVRDWLATFGVDDDGATARELVRWYPTAERRRYTADELNAAMLRILGDEWPTTPTGVCDRLEIEIRQIRELARAPLMELSF